MHSGILDSCGISWLLGHSWHRGYAGASLARQQLGPSEAAVSLAQQPASLSITGGRGRSRHHTAFSTPNMRRNTKMIPANEPDMSELTVDTTQGL